MKIDLNATQMTQQEAEAILAHLSQTYVGMLKNDEARKEFLSILKTKGFLGLVYILDSVFNTKGLEERASQELHQVWQDYLQRKPTAEERQLYERRLRIFGQVEMNTIIATIKRAKDLQYQAQQMWDSDLNHVHKLLDEAVSRAGDLARWHVWHDHGLVCYRQGDYEEALVSYQKAICLNEDDSYFYSCEDLKWCYGKLGGKDPKWYESGLAFFQGVVGKFPNRSIAYHECGWMLMHLKRFEEAINYYKQAIETQIDKSWAWSHNDLFECYKGANQYKEAFEFFSAQVDQVLNNWGIWHCFAQLQWKYSEDPDSAIESYKQAIKYHPTGGGYYSWEELGWCYSESNVSKPKSYHESFYAFQKANEIENNNSRAWFGMGWAKEMLGGWNKAINYYETALSLYPEYTKAWIHLGRCYRKKNNPQFVNSWLAYQRALEIATDPSDRDQIKIEVAKFIDEPWPDLRKLLGKHFNLDELKVLSFDLGIKYDDLEGSNLQTRVVSLIEYSQRRKKLEQLIEFVTTERPELIPPNLSIKPETK